jgi:hypothetical protein
MPWRTTALAFVLSFLAAEVPAQQDQLKDQMRKQQDAVKRAQEQQRQGGEQQAPSAYALCTGGWWKAAGPQSSGMVQRVGGGSKFDAACRAHDQCYGNCSGPAKSVCDADFKQDTAKVCGNAGTPAEKQKCAGQQDAMSTMVDKFGAGAFKQARDRCPARR